MTLLCDNVSGPSEELSCQDLVAGQLSWSFSEIDYTTNGVAPGSYVYTYDVIPGSLTSLTQQFTVTLTLDDPCADPDVTQPVPKDVEYTVT